MLTVVKTKFLNFLIDVDLFDFGFGAKRKKHIGFTTFFMPVIILSL